MLKTETLQFVGVNLLRKNKLKNNQHPLQENKGKSIGILRIASKLMYFNSFSLFFVYIFFVSTVSTMFFFCFNILKHNVKIASC